MDVFFWYVIDSIMIIYILFVIFDGVNLGMGKNKEILCKISFNFLLFVVVVMLF